MALRLALLAAALAPPGASARTVPIPEEATGLALSKASVFVRVNSEGTALYRIDYALDVRRNGGARERFFSILVPDVDGECPPLEVVLDGESIPWKPVAVPDPLRSGILDERREWRLVLREGSTHRMRVSLWCEPQSYGCTRFDFQLDLDLAGFAIWPSRPAAVACTVRFDPIVGREAIGTWIDEAVYERGTLAWSHDPGAPAQEVRIEWSAYEQPILTGRWTLRDVDPPFDHSLFELRQPCHEEPTLDSLWAAGQDGIPDTLTGSMQACVVAFRAETREMVDWLTALRDSIAEEREGSAPPREMDRDALLNPIARRNLVLGRTLLEAFDPSHPPSRIAREVDAAFASVEDFVEKAISQTNR